MTLVIVLIFGLVIGSFLNAYSWRMRHGGSVWRDAERPQMPRSAWRGRSMCPKCKKTLSWYELIPVLSFIVQGGRCRGCKGKIDWQYPLVEIATAVLFVLGYIKGVQGWGGGTISHGSLAVSIIVGWYLLSVLVVLFVYDLRYGLVPDQVVLPAIGVALLYAVILNVVKDPGITLVARDSSSALGGLRMTEWGSMFHALCSLFYALAIGAGFFALQYVISRGRWIGSGDIRIGALMGAILGWPLIMEGLVISYMVGGLVGVGLLLTRKKQFGQTVPLGTFLTLGTVIVLLYGKQIWELYWR